MILNHNNTTPTTWLLQSSNFLIQRIQRICARINTQKQEKKNVARK